VSGLVIGTLICVYIEPIRRAIEYVFSVDLFKEEFYMLGQVPADCGVDLIVTIASVASLRGFPYVSGYCASKHAVLGMTRALALEVAARGITVNAVCPGYADTDIVRNAIAGIVSKTGRTEADAMQHFTESNPQGRLVEVTEVASAVSWLCSEGAASVTGQAIAIDGGSTA